MVLEHSLTATKLAEILALTPDSPEMNTQIMKTDTSPEHFDLLNELLQKMRSEAGMDFTKLEWMEASFCSRFLSRLVEFYKASPHLYSLPSRALRAFLHTPYFSRFMRVSPLSEDLLIVHSKRMIHNNPSKDYIPDFEKFENSICLLGFLMVYSFHWKDHTVSLEEEGNGELKKQLKEVVAEGMRFWHQKMTTAGGGSREAGRYGSVFQMSWDALQFLESGKPQPQMLGAVGKMMPGLTCGAMETGCFANKSRQKRENLMNCSKCKSVAYCSPEHQKADWRKHKRVCFEPNF